MSHHDTTSATTPPPPASIRREPTLEDDGVVVPTEVYRLPPEQQQQSTDNEALKLLPHAFESLSSSAKVRLGLDHDEEQLFDTILSTTLAYERGELSLEEKDNVNNDSTSSGGKDPPVVPESLQVRVAGGWVRDKILGLQTHDVDITVDKMMGVQFATLIQKYLLSLPIDHPARCKKKYPKLAVIAANPAQSKHLETATMKVHNVDIDICHLRAEEVYEDHSRIPTVSIGTPYQDAMRRDFTLNSMFYNLKSQQVEDWSRRGMEDLRQRRLVTPLEASTTFQDDPLRVLRAIRFAVRYRLELDDGLVEAACQPTIHKALQIKVSRERVGKELEGMLSGKGADPQRALATIGRLKLAGCVFCFPSVGDTLNKTKITQSAHGVLIGHDYHGEHDDLNHLREIGWVESQRLLGYMPKLYELYRSLSSSSEKTTTTTTTAMKTTLDKRLFPLGIFLLPFRQLYYEGKKMGNPNNAAKRFAVTTFMFQEGIKFKNTDVQGIATLMVNVDPMAKFLSELAMQQQQQQRTKDADANAAVENALRICRLEAGLVLRNTKELWVTTLLLACLVKLQEQDLASTSAAAAATAAKPADDSMVDVDWIRLTESAFKMILDLDLDECWKAKPLMNGKAVIDALKLPRGPIVSTYLEEQTRWMLLNPNGTKEECEQHLHSVKRRREEASAAESEDGGGGQPQAQHPRLQ